MHDRDAGPIFVWILAGVTVYGIRCPVLGWVHSMVYQAFLNLPYHRWLLFGSTSCSFYSGQGIEVWSWFSNICNLARFLLFLMVLAFSFGIIMFLLDWSFFFLPLRLQNLIFVQTLSFHYVIEFTLFNNKAVFVNKLYFIIILCKFQSRRFYHVKGSEFLVKILKKFFLLNLLLSINRILVDFFQFGVLLLRRPFKLLEALHHFLYKWLHLINFYIIYD